MAVVMKPPDNPTESKKLISGNKCKKLTDDEDSQRGTSGAKRHQKAGNHIEDVVRCVDRHNGADDLYSVKYQNCWLSTKTRTTSMQKMTKVKHHKSH